jgi:hypothetical protein
MLIFPLDPMPGPNELVSEQMDERYRRSTMLHHLLLQRVCRPGTLTGRKLAGFGIKNALHLEFASMNAAKICDPTK